MRIKPIHNKKTEWDAVASWWNDKAADRGIYHQYTDIDPILWRVIGPVRGKNVIEIGCGNGYFSRFLAKKGAHVTAIDASLEMISFAKDNETKHPLGIRYTKQDASLLKDIKSAAFDLVVANMSIMDILRVERAIKEIARSLKPGGRFIFSMVHPAFMFEGSWQRVWGTRRFGRFMWHYLKPYVDVMKWDAGRYITKSYIRPLQFYVRALKKSGFVITDFREIATRKPVVKTKQTDKNMRRLSRYNTLEQKKEKNRARKELPQFLIINAQKITSPE